MLVWIFVILFIKEIKCQQAMTPYELVHLNHMNNLAQIDDPQHRGPGWYDYTDDASREASKIQDEESTTLELSEDSVPSDRTIGSSSETIETKRVTQMYRTCTACPHDMLKKYTNIGIKWICGGYQRARRSFKSECMMRYRNCQDGTMFVKMYDRRCVDDPYHGRHWFYHYHV